MTRDRINLSEKGELVKTELETAEVLNKFFSNIVNNLEISKYSKYESFIDNIEAQTLRTILNIKITRALLLFKINSKVEMFFYFRELEKEEIQKEIHNLNEMRLLNILTFPPKLSRATLSYFVTFCT